MIITQTPFRMSFFGGGTDMESFFRENGGAVLSTTFDKYCYVNVRHLPRFFDYSTELSYSKTERVTCIEDIQHPAIRNAMKMLDMHEIRLTYEADLPARSGLGTSSSFAVGMLNAFYALKGKYADNHSQKLLSFRYNIDTNRVEARFTDGSAVANRMPNCLRTSSTRYFTVGLTRKIECHRFFMATAENHCNVFCVTNWSSE